MTRSRTARRGLRAVAVGAAAAVAVAGCSGHGGGPAPTQHSTTPAASTAAAAPDPKAPLDVPNEVPARRNIAMTSCSGDTTHWQAGGTAANHTHDAVRYLVTVFYTTMQGTVVGSAATTVAVPASGQAAWSAPAKIKSSHGLRCVLRGVAVAG